jgi:tetratricopeptide (TPR) repeat protein
MFKFGSMLFRILQYLLILSVFGLNAQQKKYEKMLDSLRRITHSNAPDSTRSYAWADLARISLKTNDTLQFRLAKDAMKDLYMLRKDPVLGNWYYLVLFTEEEQNGQDAEKQLKYITLSAECCKKANSLSLYSKRLQKMASLELRIGKLKEAGDHVLAALELNTKANNTVFMSYNYFGLGEIYRLQENFTKAHQMYRQGYSLALKCNDFAALYSGCSNIGLMHEHRRQFDSSLYYYKKGLDLSLQNNKKENIAKMYERISGVYGQTNRLALALETAFKSLAMKEELGDIRQISISQVNLSHIYKQMKKYPEAHKYVTLALEAAKKIKDLNLMEGCYKSRGFIFEKEQKYKESLEAFFDYMVIHDSLIMYSNNQQTSALESKFHNEKKEKEIQLLNKDKLIQDEDIKKQKQFSYFIIAIALLLALTVFFILRGLRQKHRDNKMLQEKNTIIEHQKELVEEKQREVLESIHYAKRIQLAQIPSEKMVWSMITKAKRK